MNIVDGVAEDVLAWVKSHKLERVLPVLLGEGYDTIRVIAEMDVPRDLPSNHDLKGGEIAKLRLGIQDIKKKPEYSEESAWSPMPVSAKKTSAKGGNVSSSSKKKAARSPPHCQSCHILFINGRIPKKHEDECPGECEDYAICGYLRGHPEEKEKQRSLKRKLTQEDRDKKKRVKDAEKQEKKAKDNIKKKLLEVPKIDQDSNWLDKAKETLRLELENDPEFKMRTPADQEFFLTRRCHLDLADKIHTKKTKKAESKSLRKDAARLKKMVDEEYAREQKHLDEVDNSEEINILLSMAEDEGEADDEEHLTRND